MESQILVNLPGTNVPRCVSCKAKTPGLLNLQLPDVAAGSGPPDRTCVIHHGTDELLVEQHTVSDEQDASPVKEGAKHAQSLSCLLSHLVKVRRPGKLSITPRNRTVSTHCIGSPRNCTTLGYGWVSPP
jgi:hypothetical protein